MNMYEILSENLVKLRKSKNLTQAEFAEIIKYSDKSVSKWETGMSVPNIETLIDIANFYEVTVDQLVKEQIDDEKVEKDEKDKNSKKLSIYFLSLSFIWLLAVLIFNNSLMNSNEILWQVFIWALPLSFLDSLVFSAVWYRKALFWALSMLMWTCLLTVFISMYADQRFAYLFFILGIPLQIIIFFAMRLSKSQEERFKAVINKIKDLFKKKK